MSWSQQLWHMFRKDVRATTWLLLAYVMLLMIGITEAVTPLSLSSEAFPFGAFMLRLLAVVIAAGIVQADSPFNPRAHWASLPYTRSAVVAGKSLILVVLLLVTGAALVVVLQALDVPMAQMPRPVLGAMLQLAALLTATVLTASVVRNLRSVLIVLLCAVPAMFVLGLLATHLLPERVGSASGPAALFLAVGVAGLAGVLLMFRSRRVNLPIRVGVFGAATILVGLHVATPSLNAAYVRTGTTNVAAKAELTHRAGGRIWGDRQIVLAPNLSGLTSAQRVVWKPIVVKVSIVGEEARTLSISASGKALNTPVLPLPANLTWLGASPRREVRRSAGDSIREILAPTQVMLRSSDSGVSAIVGDTLISNVTDVSVRGSIEIREPRVLGRLPLNTNARLLSNGRAISVLSASMPAQPVLRLEFESVLREGFEELANYTFLLVNTKRNEAVRMEWIERSYAAGSWMLAPSASGKSRGLLKPASSGLVPGGLYQIDMTTVQFESAWLQNAELVVIEWVFVGSIPVEAHTSVQ